MKTFQYLWISSPGYSRLRLGTTDVELMKWLLVELKRMAPSFKVNSNYPPINDFEGNMVSCEFEKLDGKDREINFWLFQKLLQMGWEPFAVTHSENGTTVQIHMKREVEETKLEQASA